MCDGNLHVASTLVTPDGADSAELGESIEAAGLSGTLNIRQGKLRVARTDALATANVNVATGASLELGAPTVVGTLTGAGAIQLGADLTVTRESTFDGSIAGAGSVTVSANLGTGYGALTFSQPLNHTGLLAAIRGPHSRATDVAKVVLAKSATALSAGGYVASGGSALWIDNYNVPLSDRLNLSPVFLNHGTLGFAGNYNAVINETMGPLLGAGFATVTMGQTGSVQLEFDRIQRVDRGVFHFQGVNGYTPGSLAQNIRFANLAPGTLIGEGTTAFNRPIFPFAIGTYHFPTFVTYDAILGVRPLAINGEYSSALTTGNNVRLISPVTNDASVSINALLMDTYQLLGSGTLNVVSGAVTCSNVSVVTIANRLAFGTTEGLVFFCDNLTLSGEISGNNGLTLSTSASGTVTLTGNNTFTGPLTLNSATLQFGAAGNLGPDTGEIVINDGALSYTGGPRFALGRPLRLNGHQAVLKGNLTIDAPISGPGALVIGGDVALNGANSYAGVTEIGVSGVGTLTIGSDAMLGNSPAIYLKGGTLVLGGPWISSRRLEVDTDTIPYAPAGFVDTAGFDATLNGAFAGNSWTSFHKRGAGTLTINDPAAFDGSLFVEEGTLVLNGALSGGGTLSIGAGATLRLDGTDAITGAGQFAFDGMTLNEDEVFEVGDTGNDLVPFAVPEPSTGVLWIVAGLTCLLQSRNRTRG